MHIIFQVDGGLAYFPGLNAPFSIDTADMESQQALQVESMINNARFFDQPSHVGTPAPGAADYRTYTITVKDGQRSHLVQVSDPVGNTALQELIDYFQNLVRSRFGQRITNP
jgi:hypothetical protein